MNLLFATGVASILVATALAGCTGSDKKDEDANRAPVASILITGGGSTYTLDGTNSSDPDEDALTYGWNWEGLGSSNQSKVDVTFNPAPKNATLRVSLVVRDPQGLAGFALSTLAFGAGKNEAPKLEILPTNRWIKPGETVTMDASATTDREGESLSYEWIWGPNGTLAAAAAGGGHHDDDEDPSLVASTDLSHFTTAMLDQGKNFTLVFDKSATYNYHCHPHPWMKARLVVEAGAPTDPVTVEIRDFGYTPPALRVGVGTPVTFVNRDPVGHTATLEDWTIGTQSGGTAPRFSQTLQAGEYVARVVAKDPGGGRASVTYGVRASAEAPPNPKINETNGTAPLAAGLEDSLNTLWFNLTHDYLVNATLSWLNPTGASEVAGNITLKSVQGNDEQNPPGECAARKAAPNQTVIACKLPGVGGKNWRFRAKAENGILTSYHLVVVGTPLAKPGFGDTASAGHH